MSYFTRQDLKGSPLQRIFFSQGENMKLFFCFFLLWAFVALPGKNTGAELRHLKTKTELQQQEIERLTALLAEKERELKKLRIWMDNISADSRFTTVSDREQRLMHALKILADSKDAGVYLVISKNGKQVFIFGHCEYDADTLAKEYFRDLDKGINPDIPVNYYPDNDPSKKPIKSWRCHANTLYTNWVNYYVYQETPYEWE